MGGERTRTGGDVTREGGVVLAARGGEATRRGVIGAGDPDRGKYGAKLWPIECRDATAERERRSIVRWKSLGEADGRRYSLVRSEPELGYDGGSGRHTVADGASQPGVGVRSGRSGSLSSVFGKEGRRLGGDEPVAKSIEGIEGVRPGTGVGAEMLSLNLLGVSGNGAVGTLLALRAGRSDFLSAVAREGGDDLRGGGLDMHRSGGVSAVDGRAFW